MTRGRREGMQADTTPMETSVAVHIDALVYIPDLSEGISGAKGERKTGGRGPTDRSYLLPRCGRGR